MLLALGRLRCSSGVGELCFRAASSLSSRWKQRQGCDAYAREAKVHGLKSRAAFKLLEMDAKYDLFRPNQTVVDLGYAPGSWSQVALERTRPCGRVVGIDLLPAQPPRGVATFQGDFRSPAVRRLVRDFVLRMRRADGHPAPSVCGPENAPGRAGQPRLHADVDADADAEQPSYIDRERLLADAESAALSLDAADGLVDLVLSDMSAPWDQTSGFNANTLSNPHHRLMNTSGNAFRDHAGSMDLCVAALQFASDTLRPGGHLVCKFYQGVEDRALEQRLRRLFAKLHREKPESSRSESKEAYFVALRRKKGFVATD